MLPHERTHAGPKEGRLRLLRATRAQLEPIFLLYDGPAPVERPDREPGPRGRRREAVAHRRPDDRPRVRRQAAADRGRPSPLRDRARVRRGGGHARRARRCSSCSSPPTTRASRSSPLTASSPSPGTWRANGAGGAGGDRAHARGLAGRPRPRGDARRPARRHARARRHLVHRRRCRGRAARSRRRGCRRVPAAANPDRGRLRPCAARRGAAAEDDVLLPEADLRPALPSV